MHTNLIWLVVGIALGIIIVVIATAVSPLGNRYSISVSSDGRSGRVWKRADPEAKKAHILEESKEMIDRRRFH